MKGSMKAPTEPDTRQRLVAAAAELLWERSYQAAGVDELCARASAKKGSFYHYFDSKTDLAVAAVEASWRQTKQAVFEPISRSGVGGLAQLRAIVDSVDRFQTEVREKKGAYLGCPFGSLGQEMAHQDERLRVALDAVFAGHCVFLRTAIEAAQDAGELPVGDSERRAENVFAFLEGALLLAKVSNDPEKFRRMAAAIVAIAAT
jgi:TetR/AcrR family transcriptional repressor of nem operon